MSAKISSWWKFLALVLVMTLSILLLAACDDDTKETVPVVTKPTAPSSTVSKDPVKIGCLSSSSGPAGMAGFLSNEAIAVVEDQITKMGGILGGRQVEFIKYDDKSTVAGAIAGVTKLAVKDNVSAIVWGGATAASIGASSDKAEDIGKVPIFIIAAVPEDLTGRPYTVRARYSLTGMLNTEVDLILNNLKAETVAIMADDMEEARHRMSMLEDALEAAGVSIVSSQYIAPGTTDFAPYLTKIKYEDPDVLAVLFSTEANHMDVFKQIEEQGGWGNITYVSTTDGGAGSKTISLPGAEGSYHWVTWMPGLLYPGSKEFEQSFLETHGKESQPLNVIHYVPLWLAIKAIELAGTDDPQTVAAAARSGELEWESPAGLLTVDSNGESNFNGLMVQVSNGQLVPVSLPE